MAAFEYRLLEYKYFLSHDANVEVQAEINRLELPAAAAREDGKPQSLPPRKSIDCHSSLWNTLSPTPAAAEVKDAGGVEGLPIKEEVFVTAHVASNGEFMHNVPVSTHTPSTYSEERNLVLWDDLLTFPVKYRDLSSASQLVLTVWGLGREPLGGTTLDFFDKHGVLKTGKQKLKFYFRQVGPRDTSTRGGPCL
jgi:phosphatidylinositol 3-kinase